VQSDSTSPTAPVAPGLEFYYVSPDRITGGYAQIEGEEFAHLTHVMRHREGDIIGVVDGAGMAYMAEIAGITKRIATCALRSTHPGLHEPARRVTLAVGLVKNPSRFDFIVEKATELGVYKIVPLLTIRTIPRQAKTERWRTIALAAMKQCGRCRLPEVTPPSQLDVFLAGVTETKLLLHERATDLLDASALTISNAAITVCVGPEGGFTSEETALAEKHDWKVVSVGDRRLRTETAAIIAAARLLL
jgi:16S rRNA (uracil1498-N3)-methyltransferase